MNGGSLLNYGMQTSISHRIYERQVFLSFQISVSLRDAIANIFPMLNSDLFLIRSIHKPGGQLLGRRGIIQMGTLIHSIQHPYFLLNKNVHSLREGVQKSQKSDHMVYGFPHTMYLCTSFENIIRSLMSFKTKSTIFLVYFQLKVNYF